MEIQIEDSTVPQPNEELVVFIEDSDNPPNNPQSQTVQQNDTTMELEANQANPSTESADVYHIP